MIRLLFLLAIDMSGEFLLAIDTFYTFAGDFCGWRLVCLAMLVGLCILAGLFSVVGLLLFALI